jgi:cytochrome P450
MAMLKQFNIFDPLLKNDPLPLFSELAQTPPFHQRIYGVDSLILSRFKDVEEGFADYSRFTSVKPYIPGQETIDYFKGKKILSFVDPPEHTRLRRNLAACLSPVAVKALGDEISLLLDGALDKLDSNLQNIEVISGFTHPLAVDVVLGVLLGLPREDFGTFEALTEQMCGLADLKPGDKHRKSYDDAWDAAQAYLKDVIAGNNDRLGKGKIISRLVALNREDQSLDSEELLLQIMPLCVAGISPISSMLGSTLLMMARYPDQFTLVRQNPDLVSAAIEEILRFDPPSMFSPRYVKGDRNYEGVDVTDGTPVYLIVGATGFDPTVYADPLRFDVTRTPKPHVIFAKGAHTCLGMHLVRLLGRLMLGKAAGGYTGIELLNKDGFVHYRGSPQARDPEAIHLRFVE